MASRVYWKGLRLVLGKVRRYIQRNGLNLQASLSEEAYECVVAVLDAVLTCIAALPSNDPE